MLNQRGLLAGPARRWLWLIALLGLVWLTFSPAVKFQLLTWDDDINLQANPHLTGISAESLKWMFTDFTYQWRYQPLGWLSWFLLFELQGLNPVGYHLINLLYHLGSTVLVFLIARRLLLGNPRGEMAAILAAAVWSLHPLRVEVVVWAVELLYCQALFFLLLSYLAYLRANDEGASRKRWLTLAVVSFAFSLFTFPLALGFVAVIVVTDIYVLKRLSGAARQWLEAPQKQIWLEKLPFIALTLLAAGLNFACRNNAKGMFSAPATLEDFGVIPRVMQAFYIWAYYVWRPLWPVDLTPIPTQLTTVEPLGLVFLGSAALVFAISLMLFRNRQRWPGVWAVWLVHLAVLVPMLGLTEHPHFPSDRYSVVTSVGWAILLGACWGKLRERKRLRVIPMTAGLALVVMLATLSVRQLPFWANDYSFFTHLLGEKQLQDHPMRFNLLSRLGVVHRKAGLREEAGRYYSAALEIEPNATLQRLWLADNQMVLGKREEGRRNYLKILELSPEVKGIHTRLARMYIEEGNHAAAAQALRNELKVSAPSFALEMQYGLALAQAGELDAAREQFKLLDRRYQLKEEDVIACDLALADGYVLRGDTITAVEIVQYVKTKAIGMGNAGALQQSEARLKRWGQGVTR